MRMRVPPLPNSYWVEPGRLLAGEHPFSADGQAQGRRVQLLLAAGVRTFIDLTREAERPDYLALLPPEAIYHRLPIPDHAVPESPGHMREIQRVLAQALRDGQGVYVHCRAGWGRTGTTIGCYLRERGRAPQQALAELNTLWRQNARSAWWPTVPETEAQERYILEWTVEVAHVPVA